VKTALLDTGALVAYLDSADPAHGSVTASLGRFAGTLCTTAAVITEAMYLLGGDSRGPRHLAEFIQSVGVHIFESTQPRQLMAAVDLMAKYADTPMDFADATLVLLSEDADTGEIFTLDRRGFSTYRTRKGKGFRILPARI